jgi:hypothetical protein
MTCPNCSDRQIAYSPLSGSLVCLRAGCSWERRLTEEEVFELFFGPRTHEWGRAGAEWVPEAVSR